MKFEIGRHNKLLVLFVITAFVIRLFLINHDASFLINKLLADDAYYAYAIAENVVNGKGVVFNEGIPTNGFHPLYSLGILTILYKLFLPLGLNTPIYASLVVLSIFSIGTAVLIYLIIEKLLNKNAGLLGAFIWLFNPYTLFVSLIGVEPPVQIFLIAAIAYSIIRLDNRTHYSIRHSIFIGLLLGLVFLARMDSIFVFVGVVLALIIRKLLNKIQIVDIFKQKDLYIIAIIAFLVVLPWIGWSYLELGRITPVSGEATRLLADFNLADKSYTGLVRHSIYSTAGFIAKFFLITTDSIIQGVAIILIFLVVPITLLLYKKAKSLTQTIFQLDFLIISSVAYYGFYWFYQLGAREWYSLYTSFLLTIAFAFMIGKLVDSLKSRIMQIFLRSVIFILIVSFIFGGLVHYKKGNFPFEKLKWDATNYINENLGDVIIGSFNSGIYQYYTSKHDVINLDGVVNPEVLVAMKNNKVEEYILDKNITYIIDRPGYAQRVNNSIVIFEPIKTFKMQYFSYKTGEGLETITLFKVIPVK